MTNPSITLSRLTTAWSLTPHLTFGQFLESVENLSWDLSGIRDYSARLTNLPDALLVTALDQWIASAAVRARWTMSKVIQ